MHAGTTTTTRMNTKRLRVELEKFIPGHAVGVFAADTIPRVWTRPTAYIFNTDASNQPGSHWVAVHVSRGGDAVYFDSFGLPPLSPHHVQRIYANVKKFRWNDRRIQSARSNKCGKYCLLFLYFMTMGYGFKKYLTLFNNKNFFLNDAIIEKMYNSRFK